MSANNKIRGYQHEVRVQEDLQKLGYTVTRAWGSNGRAMGESHDVDLKAEFVPEDYGQDDPYNALPTLLVQCKKTKKLPNYFFKHVEGGKYEVRHKVRYGSVKLWHINKLPVEFPDSCNLLAVAQDRSPIFYVERLDTLKEDC